MTDFVIYISAISLVLNSTMASSLGILRSSGLIFLKNGSRQEIFLVQRKIVV
jgi:hypothetical protein